MDKKPLKPNLLKYKYTAYYATTEEGIKRTAMLEIKD